MIIYSLVGGIRLRYTSSFWLPDHGFTIRCVPSGWIGKKNDSIVIVPKNVETGAPGIHESVFLALG